jgi:hypothetical protein
MKQWWKPKKLVENMLQCYFVHDEVHMNFILCGLFNGVSSTNYGHRMIRRAVNNELERMWKEAVVA